VVSRPNKGRIWLANLEKLEHIYIDPSMDPRAFINQMTKGQNWNLYPGGSSGPPSNFNDTNPTIGSMMSQFPKVGFFTRGCHDQLQIHVGTTTGGSNTGQLIGRHHLAGADPLVDVTNATRVQDWEMIFGTNDPSSEYYAIPELRDHFLRHFGPNHRFVD
jgi:hypothetical protein